MLVSGVAGVPGLNVPRPAMVEKVYGVVYVWAVLTVLGRMWKRKHVKKHHVLNVRE